MLPVHFVNVMWGRSFTDLFLEVSLPSLLSSGNLGAVRGRPGSRYDLYTTAEDEERLRWAPEFLRLCEVLPTAVHRIEAHADTPHWQTLTDCHKDAIARAQEVEAALVFLTPDIVLGDGGVESLLRWGEGGKRAVMIGSVRLVKETFAREFTARYRRSGEVEVSVPPRELVGVALRHLHQISTALLWPPKTTWPSHVYWPVPNEGLIARCFHAHPLMVVTRKAALSFSSTIDGDYLDQAGVEPHEIHVVDDTDDVTLFELSPEAYTMGPRATPMRASEVGLWGAQYANRLHRQMFKRPIAVHRGPLGNHWQNVQLAAERDYWRIQWWLNNWLVRVAAGVVFKPARDRLAAVYRATWKRPSLVARRQQVRTLLGQARRDVKTNGQKLRTGIQGFARGVALGVSAGCTSAMRGMAGAGATCSRAVTNTAQRTARFAHKVVTRGPRKALRIVRGWLSSASTAPAAATHTEVAPAASLPPGQHADGPHAIPAPHVAAWQPQAERHESLSTSSTPSDW